MRAAVVASPPSAVVLSPTGRAQSPVTHVEAGTVTVLNQGRPKPTTLFERVDPERGLPAAQWRDVVLVLDDVHIGLARTRPPIDATLALVDGPATVPLAGMNAGPTSGGGLAGSLAAMATSAGDLQASWSNAPTRHGGRMLQHSRQYDPLVSANPEPPPGQRQPRERTLDIEVSRPDLDVRARQRYALSVKESSS